jgi:hypothetical protein
MKRLRTRLSPTMLVAIAALVVATGGTAIAAGEIITRPDQLGPSVVTSSKLASNAVISSRVANGAILQQDMARPVLRARVVDSVGGGTLATFSDAIAMNRLGVGSYRLTFDAVDLANASDLRKCALTASTNAVTPFNQHLSADVTAGPGPYDVTVATSYGSVRRSAGFGEYYVAQQPYDSGFDVILSC